MTGVNFWSSWWGATFLSGPIVMGFVFLAHSLFISRHLPVILKALENSNFIVTYHKLTQGLGLPEKIFLIGQIASLVIWPGLGIRAGQMDAGDIQNLPPRLLSRLKINISILGVASMGGVAYVVVELR